MQQEGQIANMENRNYYSLHCLQMETQLVYAHLDIFYDVLSRMAEVEANANAQVSVVCCNWWVCVCMCVSEICGVFLCVHMCVCVICVSVFV